MTAQPPDNGAASGVADQGAASAPPGGRIGLRPLYLLIGFTCLGLGFIGIVIPGMPTTIFLIIALWAFARSSPRLHGWLIGHPRFGPPLLAWSQHGVVPTRAKIAAAVIMAASFAVLVWVGTPPAVLGVTGVCLAAVLVYLVTRPGHSGVAEVPGRRTETGEPGAH